jgi:putative addiction module component (TIGR02574 family)
MSASFTALEAEALLLSPEERAELADHLLASLVTEREVEDAWGEEIKRRIAAVESGEMALSSVEQAIARARQGLQ